VSSPKLAIKRLASKMILERGNPAYLLKGERKRNSAEGKQGM